MSSITTRSRSRRSSDESSSGESDYEMVGGAPTGPITRRRQRGPPPPPPPPPLPSQRPTRPPPPPPLPSGRGASPTELDSTENPDNDNNEKDEATEQDVVVENVEQEKDQVGEVDELDQQGQEDVDGNDLLRGGGPSAPEPKQFVDSATQVDEERPWTLTLHRPNSKRHFDLVRILVPPRASVKSVSDCILQASGLSVDQREPFVAVSLQGLESLNVCWTEYSFFVAFVTHTIVRLGVNRHHGHDHHENHGPILLLLLVLHGTLDIHTNTLSWTCVPCTFLLYFCTHMYTHTHTHSFFHSYYTRASFVNPTRSLFHWTTY